MYCVRGGGGMGRLLGGGGVRLLGIIQYVSVRNWPKPWKLVAFCIVDQSKKNLTPLYLIFFFFAATRQPQC